MDGISNEIEIRFSLNDERRPDPSAIRSRNRRVLAYVEGKLEISVDRLPFFVEHGVLVLELGVHLWGWIKDVEAGRIRDFEYLSMDYAEGPLLRFVHQGNRQWRMISPWEETTADAGDIDEAGLISAVHRFLSDLDGAVHRHFGVELRDFVDAV